MDVTYNSKTGLITMHVEVVDNPDTISEFDPHGKQSLASDEAHYHFTTAPGVKVDAAALLKSLEDAHYQVDGECSSPHTCGGRREPLTVCRAALSTCIPPLAL